MKKIIKKIWTWFCKYKWKVAISIISLIILIVLVIIGVRVGEKGLNELNELEDLLAEQELFSFNIAKLLVIGLIIFFSPLISLIFKYIFRETNEPFEPKFLGLPFKDFMTPWIAFFAFLGVFGGIIQVQRQISNQDNQILIQQKQLRDARFSSGVELLGNEKESARIGGAYNLYFLANEHRKEYLEPVCEILCAHIRTITSDKDYQKKYKEKPSNEIQTILNILFQKDRYENFIFDECVKNLERVFLNGSNFKEGRLSNINFENATLNEVNFENATLNNVTFRSAILNQIFFNKATLSDVEFTIAKLSEVRFPDAKLSEVSFFIAKLSEVSFGGATLNKVYFIVASLNKVYFWDATLSEIYFDNALIKGEINFKGTLLENISIEEITREGSSLELTKVRN